MASTKTSTIVKPKEYVKFLGSLECLSWNCYILSGVVQGDGSTFYTIRCVPICEDHNVSVVENAFEQWSNGRLKVEGRPGPKIVARDEHGITITCYSKPDY